MASIYFGYILLAVGLLLLAFTFLLGYGLYQTFISSSFSYTGQKVSGDNLTAVVGSALGSIASNANSNLYSVISIILLFLFASIGYKIAFLGIRLIETRNN